MAGIKSAAATSPQQSPPRGAAPSLPNLRSHPSEYRDEEQFSPVVLRFADLEEKFAFEKEEMPARRVKTYALLTYPGSQF